MSFKVTLAKEGAEGVILGCTELHLLIKQKDVNVLLFDTLTLHAKAAVNYALEKNPRSRIQPRNRSSERCAANL
jgi:aspartate/glutamate racemase